MKKNSDKNKIIKLLSIGSISSWVLAILFLVLNSRFRFRYFMHISILLWILAFVLIIIAFIYDKSTPIIYKPYTITINRSKKEFVSIIINNLKKDGYEGSKVRNNAYIYRKGGAFHNFCYYAQPSYGITLIYELYDLDDESFYQDFRSILDYELLRYNYKTKLFLTVIFLINDRQIKIDDKEFLKSFHFYRPVNFDNIVLSSFEYNNQKFNIYSRTIFGTPQIFYRAFLETLMYHSKIEYDKNAIERFIKNG